MNDGGDFETIDFVNDQVGWITGNNTLLKTEDGGQTWQPIYEVPQSNDYHYGY